MVSKLIKFITIDIWKIRLSNLNKMRYFFVKLLRMIILAFHGIAKDKLAIKASALTYYTLLSIIPVAAMAFGIAKGFGFDKLLEKQLLEKFTGQEEITQNIIIYANSLLNNTHGSMIAGVGVVLLLWVVIKLFSYAEHSFNDIWGIKNARSYGRKFADYLSIMLITPVLLIMSGSLTVFLTSQVTGITEQFDVLGIFSPFLFLLLKLIPYLLMWILFCFIYVFLPNTKIKFSSGLIAGIIAGTIYMLAQWAFLKFQIGVVRYNAIYGSFAALPLFLIWLQLSWLIALLGAEFSYAWQNSESYEYDVNYSRISPYMKKLISLRIVNLIIKRFDKGKTPYSAADISSILELPIRFVQKILNEFVDSRLIAETYSAGHDSIDYLPAFDINEYSINSVLDILDHNGDEDIHFQQTEEMRVLSAALISFWKITGDSRENKLLKEI